MKEVFSFYVRSDSVTPCSPTPNGGQKKTFSTEIFARGMGHLLACPGWWRVRGLTLAGASGPCCSNFGYRYPQSKRLFSGYQTQLTSQIIVRWIVIYPVDSAIQCLNNQGHVHHNLFPREFSFRLVASQPVARVTLAGLTC